MMEISKTKIVIIHDDIGEKDPLLIVLRETYPDNVILINNPKEGLEYVFNSMPQKMVVLLDFNLGSGQPSGARVIEEIRKRTSLVYVIIWTAAALEDISKEDLKSMINNDALAFMSSTEDIEVIVDKINSASHHLDTRIDNALEQWIALHSEDEKNLPYILTREGKSYTLNDILSEIRHKTKFGMETEKDILLLAIDMLSRGKKKLDA